MKRWALLVIAIYFAALAIFSLPGLIISFGWHRELLRDYQEPFVWAWFALMVLGEALLLLVPIQFAAARPKPRRKLLVPIIIAGFFMSLLVVCGIMSIFLAIWGDNWPIAPFSEDQVWITIGSITIGMWIVWAIIFQRFRKSTDPEALTPRLMRYLLRGSILELFVAVPSHIIVRQRGDCCAPMGTFFGMSTGLAIMLMSFGPGVYFLFAQRIDHLRRKNICPVCRYDLRASPTRCPECGTPVSKFLGPALIQPGPGK